MSVTHRVILINQEKCSKCKKVLLPGTEVVKHRDKKSGVVYYHTNCKEK